MFESRGPEVVVTVGFTKVFKETTQWYLVMRHKMAVVRTFLTEFIACAPLATVMYLTTASCSTYARRHTRSSLLASGDRSRLRQTRPHRIH